jgi:hypothetical protein
MLYQRGEGTIRVESGENHKTIQKGITHKRNNAPVTTIALRSSGDIDNWRRSPKFRNTALISREAHPKSRSGKQRGNFLVIV